MADEKSKQPESAKGKRMKRAAEAGGYKSHHVAERLGVSAATVRHWYAGRTEPSLDDLGAFAALTGISVDYIVYGDERGRGPVMAIREWLLRVGDLVNAGADPIAAAERVTRSPGMTEDQAIRDLAFTPQETAILTGSATGMRERIRDLSEGRWDELTEDQKWDILQQIEAEALKNQEIRALREAE